MTGRRWTASAQSSLGVLAVSTSHPRPSAVAHTHEPQFTHLNVFALGALATALKVLHAVGPPDVHGRVLLAGGSRPAAGSPRRRAHGGEDGAGIALA